jgi:signal transduction histidine kinase
MEPLRAAYVLPFALAALLCFLSLSRLKRVPSKETRTGLAGLLICSGTWAGAHAVRLSASSAPVRLTAYMVGLVVGFASVGAWLYFCSAYTGHNYHRRPVVRQAALVTFLVIVSVKLTNPLHHLYFTTGVATDPFTHLTIELSAAHWVVTGLSYSLSAVGFYLLYEMFSESHLDTRALGALVGVTAIPVVLDVLAFTDIGGLVKLNYEPLGVAAFAVGVLFVVDEQFVAVPRFWRNQVIESLDDAVVLITHDEVIRDVNSAAVDRFPALSEGVGATLSETLPALWDALSDDDPVVAVDDGAETEYFLLDTAPITGGPAEVGQVLICTEITEVERQRRELERQNEQFDDFADAITHELRNTLSIAQGYLDVAIAGVTDPEEADIEEACLTAKRSLERMDRVVADLSTLARYGQTLETMETVELGAVAERTWAEADRGEMGLVVDADCTLAADGTRLSALLSNAYDLAAATGADRVTVSRTPGGFAVDMDGESVPADKCEDAFRYGEAVPSARTGMHLPTIETLCRVHGWDVELDEGAAGIRLCVTGVGEG